MKNGLCNCWLLEHLTIRNLSTLICSLLTLVLICQELYTYAVIKPTTTSTEEKELETRDLPETVLCVQPGFDSDVLEKYGYVMSNTYFRGSIDGQKFVGWNGDKNENVSSYEILEESLTVNANFLSLFSKIIFSKDHVTGVKADVEFRTLVYPHGRCLSISPPKNITGLTKGGNDGTGAVKILALPRLA